MGDPASIGPEITIKALAKHEIYERCNPLVIGDAKVMEETIQGLGIKGISIHPITSVKEALFQHGVIHVVDLKLVDTTRLQQGKISKMAGEASFQYVVKAIELAMAGEIDGTVTNALSKEAINMAGHYYSGHTEIYADYTKTKKYTMMLVHESLRVTHVSTHVSLLEACAKVKKARVLEVIQITNQACQNLGIERPRIGVAGLNPHCGENGLFGREEIDEINPAVEEAIKMGIAVEGPIPGDTIFSKAKGGMYDCVVAMYHDQGHIPLKLLGFEYCHLVKGWKGIEGVNITLGLPIIRASVDHGTAFDQAGKGVASELSLINAIQCGLQLAKIKKAV
jgi:4-hydroxythreonine-4-phosphate dehydrogenase